MAKQNPSLGQRIKALFAGKRQTADTEKASRKKGGVGRAFRRLWHVVLAVFLIGVITVTVVGCVLVVYVVSTFDADSFIPVLGEMSMDNRSVIYVKNDKGEFEPYHNLLGGTTVWVDLEKIPLNMQNAVVAIEDERYWDHEGVDWKRTASAMVNLVVNRVFHV